MRQKTAGYFAIFPFAGFPFAQVHGQLPHMLQQLLREHPQSLFATLNHAINAMTNTSSAKDCSAEPSDQVPGMTIVCHTPPNATMTDKMRRSATMNRCARQPAHSQ